MTVDFRIQTQDNSSAKTQSHELKESRPDDEETPAGRDQDRRFMQVIVAIFLVIMTGQYLYRVLERPEPLPWHGGTTLPGFKVDLNTATWIEWSQLEGIGTSLAHRIVADREVHGPFTEIDDLKRVEGIGPATLKRIRPWLVLSQRD